MIDQMGTVWRISPVMAIIIGLGLVAIGAVISGIVQFRRGVEWQIMKHPETIADNISLRKENGRLCVENEDFRVYAKATALAQEDLNEKLRRRK